MKSSRLFIWLLCLILISCESDSFGPKGALVPELVWNSPLVEPLTLANTMSPVIGTSTVVYSPTPSLSINSPLLGLDKNDGNKQWYWDDLHANARSVSLFTPHYQYQDILAYSPKSPHYGININTGKISWENDTYPNGRTYNSGFGETALHMFSEPQTGGKHNNIHLAITNIISGQWKIGYTIPGDETWRPDLKAFAGRVLANGDTLLYITGDKFSLEQRTVESFFLGYNLTQKEILFEHSGTEFFGFFTQYEDKIIASGTYLRCYDALNGILLWEQGIPNGTGPGAAAVSNGKVVVSDNDELSPRLRLFDILTGNLLWESKSIEIESRLLIHKGVIYATGGFELKAISLENGELLWSFRSPHEKDNSGAFFAPILSIDPQTDRLYTANYLYALCYQL